MGELLSALRFCTWSRLPNPQCGRRMAGLKRKQNRQQAVNRGRSRDPTRGLRSCGYVHIRLASFSSISIGARGQITLLWPGRWRYDGYVGYQGLRVRICPGDVVYILPKAQEGFSPVTVTTLEKGFNASCVLVTESASAHR